MSTKVFPVDAEHTGLRLVVFVAFLILSATMFLALSLLIPAEGINLLALLGALIIASGLTYAIEQGLKARWRSGTTVQITDRDVRLTRQNNNRLSIPIAPEVQLLRWRFRVNRRARVPKGWWVVATAITHDDQNYISVYALMSPEGYEQFDPDQNFTQLEKAAEGERAHDLRLAGEQRRLHKTESMRWHEGVEMTNEHFVAYVEHLERLFLH
jgi:hypothetical protein